MAPPDTPDAFRQLVSEFAEAHARTAAAAKALRDQRKRTKEMQAAILAYMQAHGIDECALGDSRLVRKHTKKTEGLKREHIEGELRRVLQPSALDEAVANMYNRRLTDVQETLAVVAASPKEST